MNYLNDTAALAKYGFAFSCVDPGVYRIGMKDEDLPDSIPCVNVRLTKGFYIAQKAVTQKQWVAIMGGGQYADGELMARARRYGDHRVAWSEECPVVYVTRSDALEFCSRLSQLSRCMVRLPTDAEWEIACRAGTDTRWYWGNELDTKAAAAYAWFDRSSGVNALPHVGQLKPNGIGLFDMAGLVGEWVMDLVDIRDDMMPDPKMYIEGMADPMVSNGAYAISRGGNFKSSILILMCSSKICQMQEVANGTIGFRIVVATC